MITALLILAATAATDVDEFFRDHPRQAVTALREVATTQQLAALSTLIIRTEAQERAAKARGRLQALGYADDSNIVVACVWQRFMFEPGYTQLIELFRKHYDSLRGPIADGLNAVQKAALLERVAKWRRWEDLRELRESIQDETLGAAFDSEITANTEPLTVEP